MRLKRSSWRHLTIFLSHIRNRGSSGCCKTGDGPQQQQSGAGATGPVTRENDTINLIKDERIIVTPINDIYYAEAHEKMTFVYTRRESYVMPINITEFCNKLPPSHFSAATARSASI